ncbi:MAG TPA: ABC transporter permease subunit [Nostocaceae cyanobacterium]|nr:ABC transporter permease subunit [Nostocaceae cyanobacterium]
MFISFIDRLGEFNPQLFREIKGRFKPFSVLVAVASSLLIQLVIFLYQLQSFPGEEYPIYGEYCQLNIRNQIYSSEVGNCPLNKIDFTLWWRDHWEYAFLSLSVIFVFALIVGGTYLLISDLAKEENRGTLNFIRLSPQSETSILIGKLLGVPSLIYLFVITAIPFHLLAGRSAKIATSYILAYYAILAASCLFFYSAALSFGLVSRVFSSFQPWLGSGAVLLFLFITMTIAGSYSGNYINNPTTFFRLLAPWDMINYLFPNLFKSYPQTPILELKFFGLAVGKNFSLLFAFNIVNYGICSYAIWQAMKRCFRNPNATIINKKQSYLLVTATQIMFWGLTLSEVKTHNDVALLFIIGFLNAFIILSLIFILSPQRQTIIDWGRYRHQNHKGTNIWQDLIFGEKSPSSLAILINLVIAYVPLIIWFSLADDKFFKYNLTDFTSIASVALFMTLIIIYATVTQLLLMLKTQKRYIWAIGTLSALIILPPLILSILGMYPREENALIWLFSTFPWPALEFVDPLAVFTALLGHLSIIALFNYQLHKQVKVLGESATKAILAGREVI